MIQLLDKSQVEATPLYKTSCACGDKLYIQGHRPFLKLFVFF